MKAKYLPILVAAIAAVSTTTGATAADGKSLATESGCMACHSP